MCPAKLDHLKPYFRIGTNFTWETSYFLWIHGKYFPFHNYVIDAPENMD